MKTIKDCSSKQMVNCNNKYEEKKYEKSYKSITDCTDGSRYITG